MTPAKKVSLSTTFDPKSATYAKIAGTAKIDGQAFMKQVGGTVVTAAGETVFLLPGLPYTDEMVAATADERGPYARQIDMNIDPALKDYAKLTTADATGNFSFDRLSGGDYYIITKVSWGVPQQYGTLQQGGQIVSRVTAKPGQTTKVILTR